MLTIMRVGIFRCLLLSVGDPFGSRCQPRWRARPAENWRRRWFPTRPGGVRKLRRIVVFGHGSSLLPGGVIDFIVILLSGSSHLVVRVN
jgi:hypothetical protein